MSDSPKNNNGLDPEEIRDIERIIARRSESASGKSGAGQAPVKRYLRKTSTAQTERSADSTMVINRVSADVKSEVKPPVKKTAPKDTPEKVEPAKPQKPKTVPVTDAGRKSADATMTVPVVREGKVKRPPTDKDTDVRIAGKAANKPEKAEPVFTENDDFEIDDNPEPDEVAVKGAIGALTSVAKAIIYLISVLAVSVILAVLIINVANDVFAFVKNDTEVTVVIPENCDTETLAELLGDAGAIKYPSVFEFYIKFKKKEGEYLAGTYTVSPALNYDYMVAEFKPKAPERTTVVVTIPEGYSVDQMVKLLVDKGLGTYEGYVRAINEYDFDYRFIDELGETSPDRFWRLEGYLYPDTYYYYSTATEETVIYKMLENFNNKFTEEYYDRAKEMGMTVDELITLASMIEKEVIYADEMGNVSSVFHNRLKNAANFPYLDSDATIMYAIERDTGSRPENLTETTYESPYNTYKNKGLPPGPISNPAMEAIRYAMYPNSTNYYYFVSGSNGRTVFSRTYAEHLDAIANIK